MVLSIPTFIGKGHTDKYLPFNSHHPVEQTIGIVNSLLDRAKTIPNSQTSKLAEHAAEHFSNH